MSTLAITINKYTQVQINAGSKTKMLKTNTWSPINSSFKCWVSDAGKEINAQACIQGNTVVFIYLSLL